MSIFSFLSRLTPSFEKKRLLNTLLSLEEATNANGFALDQLVKITSGYDNPKSFKSVAVVNYAKVYNKSMANKSSFISDLHARNIGLTQQVNSVIELVNKYFSKSPTIEVNGLTYSTANILKLADLIGFTIDYMSNLILWIASCEVGSAHNSLSKEEIKLMESKTQMFLESLKFWDIPSDKLLKEIESLPELLVSSENEHLVQNPNIAKMNLIGNSRFNVIYSVRMWFAEADDHAYQLRKEIKKAQDLRLIQLKNKRTGTRNPALEREIEYTEARIQKLQAKISAYEESLKQKAERYGGY